jgi:hypothetical protein
MKFRKLLGAAAIGAVLVGGSLAATPALAQHYAHGAAWGYHGGYHGGYYGGGWHGGYWGPGFGLYLGPGFFPGDYYGYAPYYYPPVVAYTPAPQSYVEQGGAAPQQTQPYYWYRCDSASGTYYPYVKDCPGGWTKVTPQPPQ